MGINCDLIIDGNYILSRLVFTLHKNNLLYGALHQALDNAMSKYKKIYPFTNVYLVSDSKEKSWRKDHLDEYKGTRKKDSDIDWKFVYQAYGEFKESVKSKYKILEEPHIEGDDWIAYLVDKSNNEGRSTMILSNDYDIKQLVTFGLDPLYINMMSNEMHNKEKLFLPENHQIFLNEVKKLPNDNIFELNDNNEFIELLNRLIEKYEVHEVNPNESLMVKIISGDKSDNIGSVWSTIGKTGKKRGIGIKGAKTIYDEYLVEFGEMKMEDPDLYENIADIICEKKKLSKTKIDDIVKNIEFNVSMMYLKLDNLPENIVEMMKYKHSKLK